MRVLVASLLCCGSSVVVTTWGATWRQLSPQYEFWQQESLGAIADTIDGPMIAAAFGTHWGFESLVNAIVAALFTAGLVLSWTTVRRRLLLLLPIPVVFSLACLLGTFPLIEAAREALHWEFPTLALGYGLEAVSLSLGVLALILEARSPSESGHRLDFE